MVTLVAAAAALIGSTSAGHGNGGNSSVCLVISCADLTACSGYLRGFVGFVGFVVIVAVVVALVGELGRGLLVVRVVLFRVVAL